MIEVPDPIIDDESSEEAQEEQEEEQEQESAEDPVVEVPAPEEVVEEPKKGKQTLKDRVQCEACGKEVSLYCLKYSHKCKAQKQVAPKPPPLEREAPKRQPAAPKYRMGTMKPALSRKIIDKANYWRDLQQQDEPESPDFELGDNLHQLHLYNREVAFRRAAGPYQELFAH